MPHVLQTASFDLQDCPSPSVCAWLPILDAFPAFDFATCEMDPAGNRNHGSLDVGYWLDHCNLVKSGEPVLALCLATSPCCNPLCSV